MGAPRVVRGYGLHEQLKEHKPAQLIAVDAEGEEVKINVPDVRQKHARVMTALQEIAWVRCDLLDKKGGLLVRHLRSADDREPPGDLEDFHGIPNREAAALAPILGLMLRAQETVLIRHQQAMQQVLDAQMRLVDSSMKRLDLQETQLQHAMTMNHALSSDLVNAQLAQLQLGAGPVDDDGTQRPPSNSDRALATFLPAFLKSAMSSDKPARPKNGAAPVNETATVPDPGR